MFEILKALMALSHVAGARTHWRIDEARILRVEIPLDKEEAEFARDMQAMFAPAANYDVQRAMDAIEDADNLLREAPRMEVHLAQRQGVEAIRALQKANVDSLPETLRQQLDDRKRRLGGAVFGLPLESEKERPDGVQ